LAALLYDGVLQSGVAHRLLTQVIHKDPDDSGKAAKFFSCTRKLTDDSKDNQDDLVAGVRAEGTKRAG
jgi:hypothetical protein